MRLHRETQTHHLGTMPHPEWLPVDREAWMDGALCPQVDWALFFPRKGQPTQPAKLVCQVCDVREECLEYALRKEIADGVWGGKSSRERQVFAATGQWPAAQVPIRQAAMIARDGQILALTEEGWSAAEIADQLGMAKATVHRARVRARRRAAA